MQNTHTADIPDSFFPRLLELETTCRFKAEDALACWSSESGVKASAYNPHGGAAGIFQVMPSTLKTLGFAGTSADFAKLDATTQLGWAEKYYSAMKRTFASAGELYTANFLPARMGHDFVCGTKDGQSVLQWAYDDNRGFDTEKKGWISSANMAMAAKRAARGPRWDELIARLNAARASA